MRSTPAHTRTAPGNRFLKIGDVARLVGISPSMLRAWERLGLARPTRTRSSYRLYTQADVRLLKRARYLRRERGLNAAAIVEHLRQEGALEPGAASTNGAGIGGRLRRLRQARGKSLAAVAKAVRTSVGFISALERSQTSASVGTLRRIAKFYDVNILDFFEASARHTPLVRPRERKPLQAGPGVRMELLAWGNTVMEPHLFRIAPRAGSGTAYSHQGEEFLYVLAGQFEIAVQGKLYLLKSGDSFYFHSNNQHRWRNPGRREALVLWVNTPPTF